MTGKHSSVPVFRTEAEERAFRESHDSSGHVDWSKAEGVRFANLKPSTGDRLPGRARSCRQGSDWTVARRHHTLSNLETGPIGDAASRRSRHATTTTGTRRDARSPEPLPQLRWPGRRLRSFVFGGRERDPGPHRTERRGKDHHVQCHQRLLRAECGTRAVPGRGHLRHAHERHRGPWPGEDVPGHHAVPGAHGHGERARGLPSPCPHRSAAGPDRSGSASRGGGDGTRPSRFWTSSVWVGAQTIPP